MPSNWIRFVHPRETTGDILEYPELAATMDRDPLSNSSNVSNFFPSREIQIPFPSLSLEIFPRNFSKVRAAFSSRGIIFLFDLIRADM